MKRALGIIEQYENIYYLCSLGLRRREGLVQKKKGKDLYKI